MQVINEFLVQRVKLHHLTDKRDKIDHLTMN